ncbi:MAG: hypothetical protein ACYDD4_11045 [Acidimicrobiales bacterium]
MTEADLQGIETVTVAHWEFWENRTPTGGSSVFLCADHVDAEAMRRHARRNGQVLTWTTEATVDVPPSGVEAGVPH